MNSLHGFDARLREIYGNFEIIDAHVHPSTPLPKTDFTLFGQHLNGTEFVSELKRMGATRCCGAVIHALEPGYTFADIHALNIAALDFQKEFPDFYIPGIAVHPAFVEESCREIETMYNEHDVRFVGELVPYMMDWGGIDKPEMDPVWDLICQKEMAVNIHFNNWEEAAAILKRFPKLKLIIAHPTANYSEYLARIKLIGEYENAALDISGSGPNSWGMIRYALDHAGPSKILYGSDFPIRNPGMYIAGVLCEKLTLAETQAVLAGNFKALVGIE